MLATSRGRFSLPQIFSKKMILHGQLSRMTALENFQPYTFLNTGDFGNSQGFTENKRALTSVKPPFAPEFNKSVRQEILVKKISVQGRIRAIKGLGAEGLTFLQQAKSKYSDPKLADSMR